MGKRVKSSRATTKTKKKDQKKREEGLTVKPGESLDHLIQQKEEIRALLSSLEDAYSEATILEDDYNDIKTKNEKKLEEVEKKIEFLESKQAAEAGKTPARPGPEMRATVPAPAAPPAPTRPPEAAPVVVEEKPKKAEKKEKKAAEVLGPEDLKKLEVDVADRVKELVEDIGTKINEKDVLEIKNNFSKMETEIEKMKALVEATRESKKIADEKIQRLVEGLAELRTTVYGREAATKEQEIKFEKILDVMNKLDPEKLVMELSKRDKEMSNQKLRIDKLEETTKEFGEMLKRVEKLIRDVGSLENVVNISNEASEKLMEMQNIERNNQKMLDKIQGLYAELSKRMEEFMLYRAKQDRLEDLVNETMKTLDDINTKSAYFVTKDDFESFKASIQASVEAAAAAPGAPAGGPDVSGLESQKEEIEMLMKSLEEEFKSGAIPKEEYEKMKQANLAKLKGIEDGINKVESAKAAEPVVPAEPPKEEKPPEKKPKKKEKPEKKKPPEIKERDDDLLKDLEETFKKGFISKEAYEKTKKMILGKG